MPESDKNLPGEPRPEGAETPAGLEEILNRARARVSRERGQTVDAGKQLLETHVDLVQDIQSAGRLANRHNSVRITNDLAWNVLSYINTNDRSFFTAIDETMRDDAKRNGFFLEEYSARMMQHRIEDRYKSGQRKYIIAEAAAQVPDAPGQFVACADAQFHIPLDGSAAHHVVELPNESDDIIQRDLVDQLRVMPYSVASLDDIVCEPAYARKGLASVALKRGLHEIITVENPARSHQKIRFVTACIASVQGVVLSNGTVWRLWEDGQITPIYNERSAEVFEHLRSDKCSRFRTAYVLRERKLNATGIQGVRSILVDWHTKVAELKE